MDPTRLMRLPGTLTTPNGTTTKDDYNNDVPATTSTSVLCWVEQADASEDTVDTLQATSGWKLYLPAGCGVTSQSTLTVGADTYQLAGPPWTVTHPRTGIAVHIEARGVQVK